MLWLVRHGQTEWSVSGRHTGRTDIPLTDQGRADGAALRSALAGRDFSLVLASPLERARETACLAGFPAAESCDDLMEWNYGLYEGRTSADLRAEMPNWSIWTHGPKGGESIDQVAARARRVIQRVASLPGDVLLFSHGHCLRILAATWLDLPPKTGGRFDLHTGTVSKLGYERTRRVITEWNVPAR